MELGEEPLVMRADADDRQGVGHLMRCLALGQAWQDRGGKVVFVTDCRIEGLERRLCGEGFQVHPLEEAHPSPEDWRLTAEVLSENPRAWLVLDGYRFDLTYQLRVRGSGHPVLVIDDMAHQDRYGADLVLNQNLGADGLIYSRESYTRLALGPKYALIRREFVKARSRSRRPPKVARKILVSLGGSDTRSVLATVLEGLTRVGEGDLDVLVVAATGRGPTERAEKTGGRTPFRMRIQRSVEDMSGPMNWAELAISSAGITSWELAFMGVPNVAIIVADNQRMIAESLEREGLAHNGGWHAELTPAKVASLVGPLLSDAMARKRMILRGRSLVDGQGASRTIELMHTPGE